MSLNLSDYFTSATGYLTTHAPDVGGTWTVQAGGNHFYMFGPVTYRVGLDTTNITGCIIYNNAVIPQDHYVKIQWGSTLNQPGAQGIVFRSNGSTTYYKLVYTYPTPTLKLYREGTLLTSQSVTLGADSIIRVVVSGQSSVSIDVYLNDVFQFNYVDSTTPRTGNYVGMTMDTTSSSGAIFDFIEAGSGTGAPPGGAAPTKIRDTFTDTNGTIVQLHTPELGDQWSRLGAFQGTIQSGKATGTILGDGGGVFQSNGAILYKSRLACASQDQFVEFILGADLPVGVYLYGFLRNNGVSNVFGGFYKFDASTTYANFYDTNNNINQTYSLGNLGDLTGKSLLWRIGSDNKGRAYVNGVLSATTTTVTNVLQVGSLFYWGLDNNGAGSNAVSLDYIYAGDYGLAVPVSVSEAANAQDIMGIPVAVVQAYVVEAAHAMDGEIVRRVDRSTFPVDITVRKRDENSKYRYSQDLFHPKK